MAKVNENAIRAALARITDPQSGKDLIAAGMISGIVIKEGNVGFVIETTPNRAARMEELRAAAEKVVLALPGVVSATAVLTAERPTGPSSSRPTGPSHGSDGRAAAAPLPGVGAIVAVASGKGGVGKSTTAANLALALAARGHRTGILDADIYGPSMPRLLGLGGKPGSEDGKTIIPLENHGVKCMSMGFLIPDDTPMIWRGPMVQSALEQMLRDVAWSPLDVLVVDLPPGTGDAQLTMVQRVPLSGAVIVSTPQDLALLDARKGLNMFRKVDVPVLGIVENMSYFTCPHCGERSEIFDHGGARRDAMRMGVDFLGEIPLAMAIRETSDAGAPITVADPGSEHAQAYLALADKVWQKLVTLKEGDDRPPPEIVIR